HHRVGAALVPALDSLNRVERAAGGVHADLLANFIGSQDLTYEGEDERLRHAHDRELVTRVADLIDIAAGPDHADAEQTAGDASERGVDLRVFSVGVRLECLVGLNYQFPDTLVGWQVTCGDID